MRLVRRSTGSVRNKTRTTHATNSAKIALHNHRVVAPKIPNFSSSRRTTNNVASRLEMVRLTSVYLRGSRQTSSSDTGATRNKTQGRDSAILAIEVAPRCFPMGRATKNAPMSERNKSYPNREQPKVAGLATFVTDLEGLKQNLVRAEMVEIPDLHQSKPRDKEAAITQGQSCQRARITQHPIAPQSSQQPKAHSIKRAMDTRMIAGHSHH